jgi:hypothetical protein
MHIAQVGQAGWAELGWEKNFFSVLGFVSVENTSPKGSRENYFEVQM